MREVITIQSSWRSYKCRKKVKYFSSLPSDIWEIILKIFYINNQKFLVMESFAFKKLILFTWSAPNSKFESKLKLINFISRNVLYFDKKIVEQCLELCKRLVVFTHEEVKCLYINSCIEKIMDSNYSCK